MKNQTLNPNIAPRRQCPWGMGERSLRLAAIASMAIVTLMTIGAGCTVQKEPESVAAGVEETGHAAVNDQKTLRPDMQPGFVDRSDDPGIPGQDATVGEIIVTSRKTSDSPVAMSQMMARKMGGVAECCPRSIRPPVEPVDRENYEHFGDNPVKLTSRQPVSTFSIDVDTGAYSNVRRFLNGGNLPPEDAIRVEELINYFSYDYPVPDSVDVPFAVATDLAAAPWNADRLLMQIGIKGYEVSADKRSAANLVFLVDVSGSMNSADKLPLLKNALKMLTRELRADDRVSMVVYAGASGVVLEPTAGDKHFAIVRALDELRPGGSTNGASGIRLAYQLAEQSFIEDGINRVMLATDGDFNVGTVDFDALVDLIERKRVSGISLTTLGFGTGNYNDHLMEQLADSGNGNYAYIDTLNEGRKVLVDELNATLQTIASDVKIQVEFNPAVVAEYRLIGYENRMLRREDFNNDKIDAGEIGAGHTVTALYELTLVGSSARLVDPLRYGTPEPVAQNDDKEIAFVRLRYKAPDRDTSELIERPIYRRDIRAGGDTSAELQFAASVAAFGQLLRGGEYVGDYGFDDVAQLAARSRGKDFHGYRSEFLRLVRLADSLSEAGRPKRQAMR